MKTIGLLGGMSWESTLDYYRLINKGVNQKLGGMHSAKIILHSVDFDPIEKLAHQGDWQGVAAMMIKEAKVIESAGADCLLICTNTMHKVAAEIRAAIQIPLLHIADATAEAITRENITSIGLLGTRFTMEQAFYTERLNHYGLQVLTPGEKDRQLVHDVIFQELCLGKTRADSRTAYLRIIEDLAVQGAQGVILGCTEIAMLIKPADTDVRLFDTTAIHAEKAVEFATQPGLSSH